MLLRFESVVASWFGNTCTCADAVTSDAKSVFGSFNAFCVFEIVVFAATIDFFALSMVCDASFNLDHISMVEAHVVFTFCSQLERVLRADNQVRTPGSTSVIFACMREIISVVDAIAALEAETMLDVATVLLGSVVAALVMLLPYPR